MPENTTTRSPKRETARRRRKEGGGVVGRRLGVRESLLDLKTYKYRWISDYPAGRLFAKTQQDDWEIMTQDGEKDDSTGLGAKISVIVGKEEDGSQRLAFLCRKLKTFFDEDYAEQQKVLDEQLKQLRAGNDASGEAQSDYVPRNAIRV
jgi:hypothetical protein